MPESAKVSSSYCCNIIRIFNRKLMYVVYLLVAFGASTYMNVANPDGSYLPALVGRQVKWSEPACLHDDTNALECINGASATSAAPALAGVGDWLWRMSFGQKYETITSVTSLVTAKDWFVTSQDVCHKERHGVCHTGFGGYCACACRHPQHPMLYQRKCLTTTEYATELEASVTVRTKADGTTVATATVQETQNDSPGTCSKFRAFFDHVTGYCTNNKDDPFQIVDGWAIRTDQYQPGRHHETLHHCKETCQRHPECKMFAYSTHDGVCTLIPELVPHEFWVPACNAHAGPNGVQLSGTLAGEGACAQYLGFRRDGFQLYPGHKAQEGKAFKKVDIGVVVSSHERLLKCQAHCKKHSSCSGVHTSGSTCILLNGKVAVASYGAHDAAVRHCPPGLEWSSQGVCEL